jgi:hypothetical protein
MSHDPPDATPAPEPQSDPSLSRCSVAFLSPHSLSVWACPKTNVGTGTTDTTFDGTVPRPVPELALGLAPGRLVVVGRSAPEHTVPYLDPAYRSTTVLPDSNRSVLHGNDPTDNWVSRAHFMLRGAPDGGVVFTNGVPAAGGGIRPPTNRTKLVAPTVRYLEPGEEVLIACGEAVAIRLPNGCTLQLAAR